MMTRAALIGLRVVLDHINSTPLRSPIGLHSGKSGGLSPCASAHLFCAPNSLSHDARARTVAGVGFSPSSRSASATGSVHSLNHDAASSRESV